jgi:hypothetical protein
MLAFPVWVKAVERKAPMDAKFFVWLVCILPPDVAAVASIYFAFHSTATAQSSPYHGHVTLGRLSNGRHSIAHIGTGRYILDVLTKNHKSI